MAPKTLEELFNTLPQSGQVTWMALRPSRRASMQVVTEVDACTTNGLIGDRYMGTSGKRQVTLIQTEHLSVIASLLNCDYIEPESLRRNIAVRGLNLLALKGKQFQIGSAVLEYTGPCHPCSFMETTFGPGGYNAIRGHGGITARVIESGVIALNDPVKALPR